MCRKVIFEDVKLFFEKFDCELISEEYINAKSKLKFRCSCGEIDNTTYDSFKNREHKMCKKCAKKISSSKKKLSFEFVKSFFENNNCVLLSTDYKGNRQKLDYICECGNVSKITFAHLQRGQRCEICHYKKISDKLTLNYDDVKLFFEENGCILLETFYINAKTNMRYVCECGEESTITFSSFQNGSRCKRCGFKKSADKNRRSIEEIIKIFEDENCILITVNYLNTKQNLEYICSCGNKHSSNLETFLAGGRCKECTLAKLRFSYEYIKHYFEENDCVLLTKEYKRSDQDLEYVCSCGRLSQTQFYRFKIGQRCMKCRDEKYNIGENSRNWNGGITNISAYVRSKMNDWKKESEIACDYKCVITGSNTYDVHHLNGFSSIFNEAMKLLNFPINKNISDYTKEQIESIVYKTKRLHKIYGIGICLSEDIHYDFHKRYGFTNTDLNQFLEFIKNNYQNNLEKIESILPSQLQIIH